MIGAELHAEIRRKFFGEHWRVGTIAATLGVHHDTVRRVIEVDRFTGRVQVMRPRAVEPYRALVVSELEKYPRLAATVIHRMLSARGFSGGVHAVRTLVREVRPRKAKEAFLRLATLPGEQAQVDWASFGKMRIGHHERALSCFVMVLAHSRRVFACFVLDMKLEVFLWCHVLAFEYFGGVPRHNLYDNLKSVVLEREGTVIRFNPRFLDFAGHYRFAPVPVGIRRGNEKGRVERAIRYLRESFFAGRRYRDLDDLNAQLSTWLVEVSDQRPHDPSGPAAPTVHDVYEHVERPRLLPVPATCAPVALVQPTASGKTPYVRFDTNDYSIPAELVRKSLTLVATHDVVRVLDGNVEVARHARCWDKRQLVDDPVHTRLLRDRKRESREHGGRHRLFAACPHGHPFLDAVARQGGHLGGTTSTLLRLLDTHGARALDRALAQAIEARAFAAHSVAHLIAAPTRARREPPPIPVVLPDDPRARNLAVPVRDLAVYDAIRLNEEKVS
jgi:transposase